MIADEFLPLRTIPHGEDELAAYEKDASESQDDEYIQSYSVSERVEFWI